MAKETMLTVTIFHNCERNEKHLVPITHTIVSQPGIAVKCFCPEAAAGESLMLATNFMEKLETYSCRLTLKLGKRLIDIEVGRKTRAEDILWCMARLIASYRELVRQYECPTLGKKEKNNGGK